MNEGIRIEWGSGGEMEYESVIDAHSTTLYLLIDFYTGQYFL